MRMDDDIRAQRGGRGCNVLMLLILAMLVAGLAFWGWLKNPPSSPEPSGTAAAPPVPGS
jgi:hypothetical protein